MKNVIKKIIYSIFCIVLVFSGQDLIQQDVTCLQPSLAIEQVQRAKHESNVLKQVSNQEIIKLLQQRNWYYHTFPRWKKELLLSNITSLDDELIALIKKLAMTEIQDLGLNLLEEDIISFAVFGSWCYVYDSMAPSDLDVLLVVSKPNIQEVVNIEIPFFEQYFKEKSRVVDNCDVKILSKDVFENYHQQTKKEKIEFIKIWGHAIFLAGEIFPKSNPDKNDILKLVHYYMKVASMHAYDLNNDYEGDRRAFTRARNLRKITRRFEEAWRILFDLGISPELTIKILQKKKELFDAVVRDDFFAVKEALFGIDEALQSVDLVFMPEYSILPTLSSDMQLFGTPFINAAA